MLLQYFMKDFSTLLNPVSILHASTDDTEIFGVAPYLAQKLESSGVGSGGGPPHEIRSTARHDRIAA